MDAGLLVGVGLAKSFDLSRNRVLIIDAGALTGGLFGSASPGWRRAPTTAAAAWLPPRWAACWPASASPRRRRATWTRRTSATSRSRRPSMPAMLARDADGRWSFGTPGALPVFDGTGSRLVGATFSAVGGQF